MTTDLSTRRGELCSPGDTKIWHIQPGDTKIGRIQPGHIQTFFKRTSPKHAIIFAAALCAFAACWLTLATQARTLCRDYTGASVRVTSAAPAYEAVKRAIEKNDDPNIAAVTAWNRGEITEARNEALGRSVFSRPLRVMGDMYAALPAELLFGAFPDDADKSGCAVEQNTAYALFGTTNAVGAKLAIDGETFRVRGVYAISGEADADAAAVAGVLLRGTEKTTFENLELSCGNVETARQSAEQFIFRFSLASTYVIIENGLWALTLQKYGNLPAWVAAAALLAALLSRALKLAKSTRNKAFVWAGFAACAVAIVLLLRVEIFVPQKLLPTRWSDFSGIAEIWKSVAADARAAGRLTPLPRDTRFSACAFYGCAALVLSLVSIFIYTKCGLHLIKSKLNAK